MPNHYEVLKIHNTADSAAIKKAYRRLALTHHPDKTLHLPDADRQKREKIFKLATLAYEVLGDVVKRASYDRTLRSTRTVPGRPAAQPPPPRPARREPPYNPTWAPRSPPENPTWAPPSTPPPPRPRFNLHVWSAGALPPTSFSTQPWFYAPVSETETRTVFNFKNHQGWDFSIGLTRRFKFLQRPLVPVLQTDTRGQISITFLLQRDNTVRMAAFIDVKEVHVTVDRVPGHKEVALSSLFVESRVEDQGVNAIELRISLATGSERDLQARFSAAWDVDCGFLAGFFQRLRVTHLVFWLHFPRGAFNEDGEVPTDAKDGSPMCYVKQECPDIVFVKLGKAYYCQEQTHSSKKLWRVAAVGTM
ncbi:hypothetical protein HBI24_153790 [Parastagonospora nodorum]|nr:hypothetical protein HBI09_069070 [Parastagonospora nodorum]KAH4204843.1 hypothetical protein HBI95_140040 [Parastagonospora nodorum]KAH5017819.1 hypothetical protein HBI77_054560 [Parastagonospora nodorum]KAH5028634.1 hypothetical protein HBI75_135750 [Parastagonospora nodorum]KAH5114493.1 hypothetical protein HBH71_141210 [Parastagonospora nodorum]